MSNLNLKQKLGLMGAFLLANIDKSIFDTGRTYTTERKDSKPYNLPKWNVGGHIIYAKDEKTAIKYEKKRGLWKEGIEVKGSIDKTNNG